MSSGTIGAQDWRAVACLSPSGERLLCVGESSSQVRAAYTGAWGEVIRDEDRPTVRESRCSAGRASSGPVSGSTSSTWLCRLRGGARPGQVKGPKRKLTPTQNRKRRPNRKRKKTWRPTTRRPPKKRRIEGVSRLAGGSRADAENRLKPD